MNNNTAENHAFLQKLRTVTAQSHTALEELPISKSIIKPDVSNQEYINYLTLMYNVIKDTEENIYPIIEHIFEDLGERKKSQHLENDIKVLGAKLPESNTPLTNTGFNATPGFAVGIMYVIEGSTLGGRVIYKNINNNLGHTEESGASYFAGYGNTTGSHWKKFLEKFTAYTINNNCEAEVMAGADYAFNAIRQHLS